MPAKADSQQIINAAIKQQRDILTEDESKQILANYGIPITKQYLARTLAEAEQHGAAIGYPLVLKIVSPDITHKSDVGGVKVGIQDVVQLREAYYALNSNALKVVGPESIWGVLVQEMVRPGTEVILGMKRDALFGPAMMLGLGGVWVELLQDIAIRVLPINLTDVQQMLAELKGGPLLQGYRGASPRDQEAIADVMIKLAQLAAELDDVAEIDLNPVIVAGQGEGLTTVDARIVLRAVTRAQPKQSAPSKPALPVKEAVEMMLNPRSIAVIGASADENKNGGRLVKYLLKHGFKGEFYPINPNSIEIKGYKCYPSIGDLPGEVDLACIIVPVDLVADALRQCGAQGVKTAIVYTSGFGETGSEGREKEHELVQAARLSQLRFAGPNTVGIVSPSVQTFTAFGMALEVDRPISGNIAFVTQSGAMGGALLSRAWEKELGFSRWISSGNEADLQVSDYIEYLIDDPMTKVIAVYMEGLQDGQRFMRVAQMALRAGKPIVVYKSGRSAAGASAVQSHTGVLAGDDAVYDAVFRQLGVIRVSAIGDLFEVAHALASQPAPKGIRVGVISTSGGACSILADECARAGLAVARFSQATEERISRLIPSFGSAKNPVDITAQVLSKPAIFKDVLEAIAQEQAVDSIIVMLTTSADPVASLIAQAIIEVQSSSAKTLLVARMGAEFLAPRALPLLRENQIPVYATPDQAVRILKHMVDYGKEHR